MIEKIKDILKEENIKKDYKNKIKFNDTLNKLDEKYVIKEKKNIKSETLMILLST